MRFTRLFLIRFILTAILILVIGCIGLGAFGQDKDKQKPPEDKTKPNIITPIDAEKSHLLKDSFETANQVVQTAQPYIDKAQAALGKRDALYYQILLEITKKGIDTDKYDFGGFNDQGLAFWIEKPPEKKETKDDGKHTGSVSSQPSNNGK